MNRTETITMSEIKLNSILPISQILDIKLEHRINEHGILTLRGYLEREKLQLNRQIEDTEIELIQQKRENDKKDILLFYGLIKKIYIFQEAGMSQIIIVAVSGSQQMDREKKSRSFQNINLTYEQIVQSILAEYDSCGICTIGEGVTIKEPIIQYEETDWEFLKRLSSHFHGYLLSDLLSPKAHVWFGMRDGEQKIIPEKKEYEVGIDKRYYEEGAYSELSKDTFLYYRINETGNYEIGDKIHYLGKDFIICEKLAQLKKGEIQFIYKIAKPQYLWTKTVFNSNFIGLALKGEVMKTEGEKVYIGLDIDGENKKGEYPYSWTPETGNIMYCMPKIGTKVNLYFGSSDERKGKATNSLRTNGSTCAAMSDSNKRGLETEHGKELNFYPSVLSLKSSMDNGNTLEISLNDDEKLNLESHNKIEFISRNKIRMEAPIVSIHMPQQIQTYRTALHIAEKEKQILKREKKNPPTGGTGNTDSYFGMNFQFNALGKQGILCGTEFVSYSPFQDAPQVLPAPQNTISWGAVLGAIAVAAVAIVAAVVLAPAVAVATILTCAAIGAVAAGVTSVASSAIKGEEIDPKKVIIDMSFGAASGAFAATPIGVGGQVVFNGLSSGFQSWLEGGDTKDMIISTVWGGFTGYLGGNGYGYRRPGHMESGYGLHFFDSLYRRDAAKVVIKGSSKGIGANVLKATGERFINMWKQDEEEEENTQKAH